MENTLILAMLCALLSACGQKGALYLPNTPTPTKLNSNIIDESTLDAVINSPSNGWYFLNQKRNKYNSNTITLFLTLTSL